MSLDEITAIREDIAELRAIVDERSKFSASHASLLRVVVGAVLVQLVTTVFFAGQKTQMLDRLTQDVASMQQKFDSVSH